MKTPIYTHMKRTSHDINRVARAFFSEYNSSIRVFTAMTAMVVAVNVILGQFRYQCSARGSEILNILY